MKKINTILAILLLAFTSCEYVREEAEKEELQEQEEIEIATNEETSVEISYLVSIRPIIETSCKTQQGAGTGCHDAWIDNYQDVRNYLNSGVWQSVVLDTKRMPIIPNSFDIDSLDADEIKVMTEWIEQGYPEN